MVINLKLIKARLKDRQISASVFHLIARNLEYFCNWAVFPLVYLIATIYLAITNKRIRVFEIDTRHIGGWVATLDSYLRRGQSECHQTTKDIFLANPKQISNKFFFDLMKSKVQVVTNFPIRILLTPLARITSKFRLIGSAEVLKLNDDSFQKPTSIQWFSHEHHVEGRDLLRRMGITFGQSWYVCFSARDSAYNENLTRQLDAYKLHHQCRDSDINTYRKAIDYIISKGGYVIRMGSVVKNRVAYSHPHFIDYPFSTFKSDFADFYLACHCNFSVGNASGAIDLSRITDVPMAMVNYYLWGFMDIGRRDRLTIPKLIKYKESGDYISIRDYFALFHKPNSMFDLMYTMENLGLTFEDNSEDDILEITKAMYRRFIERSISDAEWAEWQRGSSQALAIDKLAIMWPKFIESHPHLLN